MMQIMVLGSFHVLPSASFPSVFFASEGHHY